MRDARAVFVGRVVSVEDTGAGQVHFKPLAVWKGLEVGARDAVVHSVEIEHCTFRFELGKDYLVYAYDGEALGVPAQLATSLCNRTSSVPLADDDLEALPMPAWKRYSKGPEDS